MTHDSLKLEKNYMGWKDMELMLSYLYIKPFIDAISLLENITSARIPVAHRWSL
jgi:hypothetical protein